MVEIGKNSANSFRGTTETRSLATRLKEVAAVRLPARKTAGRRSVGACAQAGSRLRHAKTLRGLGESAALNQFQNNP